MEEEEKYSWRMNFMNKEDGCWVPDGSMEEDSDSFNMETEYPRHECFPILSSSRITENSGIDLTLRPSDWHEIKRLICSTPLKVEHKRTSLSFPIYLGVWRESM